MSARDQDWEVGFDSSGAPALVLAAGGDGSVRGPRASIPIPAGLATDRARLIPRLARVLWVWDSAGLELGECAIVTTGSADTGLFLLVASWRTGREPVCLDLGDGAGRASGVAQVIQAAEPQRAIESLAARLRPVPGAAALVLSASARAIDVLLEALPTWGRILLGTPAMEPTAIDFYNHVHRKGARLQGVPATPSSLFDPALRETVEPQLRRATRILRHEALAASCLQQAV